MNIKIGRLYYPVTTLGPGKRVCIWMCGCPFNCAGCLSNGLKDISNGKDISVDELVELIDSINGDIDGITIFGGAPFYQSESLLYLLRVLSDRFEDIILFTGYEYEDLQSGKVHYAKEIIGYISLLIDGKFDKDDICVNGLRGSNNQKIIIIKNIYGDLDFYKYPKRIQLVYFGKDIVEIGIPGGN